MLWLQPTLEDPCILPGVIVIVLAETHLAEPPPKVQGQRGLVRGADLEEYRANALGRNFVNQPVQKHPGDPLPPKRRVHCKCGQLGLIGGPPDHRVTNDVGSGPTALISCTDGQSHLRDQKMDPGPAKQRFEGMEAPGRREAERINLNDVVEIIDRRGPDLYANLQAGS